MQALGNFDANRIRPIVSVDYAMAIKKALLIRKADALKTGSAGVVLSPRAVWRWCNESRPITRI